MNTNRSANHWGHITREDAYYRPNMALDAEGNEYVADNYGPMAWKLRCDCGYGWEIVAKDFPGRRQLKSCGRPECKYTPQSVTRKIKERGSAYSIYIPISLAQQIAEFADAHNTTFSKACEVLCREGLVSKLVNE